MKTYTIYTFTRARRNRYGITVDVFTEWPGSTRNGLKVYEVEALTVREAVKIARQRRRAENE